MVLSFVCLIALVNWCLERGQFTFLYFSQGSDAANEIIQTAPLTFQRIVGWVFYPFAWLMGIPKEDIFNISTLLGEKIVLNEFIAYLDLIKLQEQLNPRSFTIATYALCGFANFGSVAVQIGGIGSMVPSRRSDIVQLSMRSMIAGTLTAFSTACLVGMLI